MDSLILNYVVDNGASGVIIEGLGRGNVPPMMIEGIKKCVDNNIPVVLVSRCFEGRVYESYGYEGGGKHLKDLGVIFGGNMQGQKARIKLMVDLSYSKDIEFIKNYVNEH